jgi:CheY-like chemotaxis protein
MADDRLTLAVVGVDRSPLALLVDRDADTRHMYAEFLRAVHCDIDEAADGPEALAKAIARHPDVIVAETSLPGIDGYDLCRLIRKDPLTCDIPFLFVTANTFETDVTRANAAGADAVLAKPCLPEHLASAIDIALERSYRLRQRIEHLQTKVSTQVERSLALVQRSDAIRSRRRSRNRQPQVERMSAPAEPPRLHCPQCQQRLRYVKSHMGGMKARDAEQWDYFDCPSGCGSFQYRHRTRKLRHLSD